MQSIQHATDKIHNYVTFATTHTHTYILPQSIICKPHDMQTQTVAYAGKSDGLLWLSLNMASVIDVQWKPHKHVL